MTVRKQSSGQELPGVDVENIMFSLQREPVLLQLHSHVLVALTSAQIWF